MKKNNSEASNASKLRKRAEKVLRGKLKNTEEISRLSLTAKDRLIEELQVYQVELEMQNEKLRDTQLELEASRDRFSDLYDFAPVGYFTLSSEGIILSANLTGAAMLGVERSFLIKKRFPGFISKNDQDIYYHNIKKISETNVKQICELGLIKKDGPEFHAQLESIGIKDEKGNLSQVRVIVIDITERKRAEEQIKKSLREKEVLLKEIHHRVKNNLQAISSLLSLQSGYVEDTKALEVLTNSQKRVRAMALVHERLYQSRDLEAIDVAGYIRTLITELFVSGPLRRGQVQLKMEVEDVAFDIDTLIPLGLIINELVTNSFKHAFPDNRKGYLQVSLRKSGKEKDTYTLVVRDNGIGFSKGLDLHNSNTLGLLLVRTMVKQLHGVIGLERKGGTTFIIKFKKKKQKG